MGSPNFNAKVISRGSGTGSAVASAAYRHNSRMKAEYDGKTSNYELKDDLVHSDVMVPGDAEDWAHDAYGDVALARELDGREATNEVRQKAVAKLSERLWNDLEQQEVLKNMHHKRAQLARSFTISLPTCLSREDQIALGKQFFEDNFASHGMVVDWVIHDPKGKENDNPHIHAMVSLRELGKSEWGVKNRDWNAKSLLLGWRSEWAVATNIALERAGFDERIDLRSLKDQGIELEPTSYDPYVADHAERVGDAPRAKDRAGAAKERNKAYLLENPEHILRVVQAERSVFGEEDVRAAFEKRMGGSFDLDGLTAQAMGSRDIVLVAHLEGEGGAQYMTKAQASIETNLMVDALELNAGRLAVEGVTDLTGVGAGLGEEQVAALVEMVSDKRLSLITGYAGAGKTRTIGAAAQVWRDRGFEVLGGAVAGKATQELMNIEGMAAASLAAWEARWSQGQSPREGRFVFFMDEAGMVGSSHWERVQKRILDMGGKLIAVGDPEQLQPVLDTGAFVALQDRVGVKVIDVVRRMENPLEREATRLFALGEAGAHQALDYYKGAGCIVGAQSVGQAFEKVVEQYFEKGAAGDSRVAAFYTNKDANEGNDRLHERAVELGVVLEGSLVEYGLIRRIDRTELHPKVVTAPMVFGAGERVRFTRPHRDLNIPKSSFATVLEARAGAMDLLIDGDAGRRVTIDMSGFDHFDYGYGATTHALQGMTVDHVLAVAHPRMTRHVSYVMMSRHAKSVEMIVPASRFEKVSFEDVATRSGYLNAQIEERADRHVVRAHSSVQRPGATDVAVIAGRDDYVQEAVAFEDGVVLEDAHVSSVFRHYHGLLNAEYIADAMPMFGEDPHGFVDQPERVVDHLVKGRSAFTVSDVADALSKVVIDPESFGRLFYGAMEHPDLVVLREEGPTGGRVYSTAEQVARELWVMDRGVALAFGSQDPQLEVGAGYIGAALAQGSLDARVAEAVRFAGQGGQIRLISGGSGSGKTQALSAVAQSHDWAGFDVVAIAPTRRTAAQFGMQAGVAASSFGSLVYGLEHGTKHLDQNSVIVLDHSELMGLDDADRLLDLVSQSGAKLVATYGQDGLSSIGAGDVFGDLVQRVGSHELGESLRIGEGIGRELFEGVATQDLHTDVFDRMLDTGALVAGGTPSQSIAALAQAYVEDQSSNKIAVASSNWEVAQLNEAIANCLADRSAPTAGEHNEPLGYDLKALRVGDQVVLADYYMPARLPASEQGVVIEADETSFTLRLGRVQDERYVNIERNDGEFRVGLNFAKTIHTAQGMGHSSVHVLGSKGMSSGALSTAIGLHNGAVRIVVPTEDNAKAVDLVKAIAQRAAQDPTIASLITDEEGAVSQVSVQANAFYAQPRGLHNPYAAQREMSLSPGQQVNAEYLKEHPAHVLTLLGSERTLFVSDEIEAAFTGRLGVSQRDVAGLMEKVMAHPALVALDSYGPGGHRLYTTRAHVVQETNLVAQAKEAAQTPLTLSEGSENFALAGFLGDGQKRAIRSMLDEQRITLVTGYAGAGKTTAISEAVRVWRDRGYDVLGGAQSGAATQKLSGIEGMQLANLAAWEAKWARGTRPKEGQFVFFMDEAAMVGSDVWGRVQSRVLAMGGKLVAVGDPEQLQPIGDSNVFKALEADLGAVIIDEVRRQRNPVEQGYTKMLARGGDEAVTAVRGYQEQGAIQFVDTEHDAIAAITTSYLKAVKQGETRRALAYTIKDVCALNEAIRMKAVQSGVIDTQSIRNYGVIERLHRTGGVKRVETAALLLGVGDEVIFTAVHKELNIPKSSFATVEATRDGEIDLLLDGDDVRRVTVDMAQFNKLDYGFASTIAKSQGDSKERNFVLGHGYMDRHTHYVSMSRHINSMEFYVPRTRVPDMASLEKLVQRNSYQSLAALEGADPILEAFGSTLGEDLVGARADLQAATLSIGAVTFEADAHLASVANRMTGLLESNYAVGDPVLADDPRGYGQDPQRIVDDIIARQSTLRASEVSRTLSGVAREPDTFARLFKEAMSHPDLVVLSEEGINGEGRVYSTKAQVALELDVIDRGVRLALLGGHTKTPNVQSVRGQIKGMERVAHAYDLSSEQRNALGIASDSHFSIVSGGSASGKSRLAAAIGDVHAQDGWSVVRVAPTGVGADNLRNEGGETQVMTVAALEYAIGTSGRIRLGEQSVIILDEAGQVGAKTADRLLQIVEESGAKLVALRDNDQLGPYEAAPIFRTLEARIGGVELAGKHRSQNTVLGLLIEKIGDHDTHPADATQSLMDAGVMQAGGTRSASIAKLAADFVADPNFDKIALAHSRVDVAALNQEIRICLDQRNPERTVSVGGGSQPSEGTLGDLRVGDRIVLASQYKSGKQWFRAGTSFEVERQSGQGDHSVILRSGAGDSAQYLKFEGEDADFEYRMGFASTVHGEKGRGRASVHMLATPGMSKNIFYTGAALHKHSLNVVLPASNDTLKQAVQAIMQTPDTVSSVLDYGFDALAHAREAVKLDGSKELLEPNKLVDGFDRVIDWVADRLDGGADQPDLPSRAVRLRALVVAELISARGDMGDGRHGFTAADRSKVERNVDQLINRRAWDRLLGSFGREASTDNVLDRFGEDASTQDRMVARILERGATAAKAAKDDGLREWFAGAAKALELRVENSVEPTRERAVEEDAIQAEIAKWREAQAQNKGSKLVEPASREGDGDFDKDITQNVGADDVAQKKENVAGISQNKEVPTTAQQGEKTNMDYAPKLRGSEAMKMPRVEPTNTENLARAITSAISRHVDYADPVHEQEDLNRDVLCLLERSKGYKVADPQELEKIAQGIALKRRVVEVKLELIEEVIELDPQKDSIVNKGRAMYQDMNPFASLSPNNAKVYKEMLPSRLDEIGGQFEARTAADYEAAKLTIYAQDKDLALLAVAKAATVALGFEKVEELNGRKQYEIREEVIRELAVDRADPSLDTKEQKQRLLDRVYTAFTRNEIASLIDPNKELAKSLGSSEFDRSKVKETLKQLNNVHHSRTAPRHSSGALSKLITPVHSRGIGFEM